MQTSLVLPRDRSPGVLIRNSLMGFLCDRGRAGSRQDYNEAGGGSGRETTTSGCKHGIGSARGKSVPGFYPR